MATARELLAQADALMRRNRARAVDTEVSELADVVQADVLAPPPPSTLDDVPELTDAVEEIEIASIAEFPDEGGEPSAWIQPGHDATAPTGSVPDPTAAAAPAPPQPDGGPAPPSDAAAAAPAASAPADEWARWEALAEEIRMQVLQRIDLFTATGLREQLGAQLRPIVERAGAEMVATISERVGDLLRSHVGEAIEREIEKSRKGDG